MPYNLQNLWGIIHSVGFIFIYKASVGNQNDLAALQKPWACNGKKTSPLTGRNLEQTRLIWGGGAPADGQLGKEGEWGKDRERTHRSYLQLHVSNMPKNASGV